MEAIESARRARRNCSKTAPRRDCSVPWKKIFVPTYRSSSFYGLLLESPDACPTSLRQKQLTCCCLVWLRLWGQPPSSLTGGATASELRCCCLFLRPPPLHHRAASSSNGGRTVPRPLFVPDTLFDDYFVCSTDTDVQEVQRSGDLPDHASCSWSDHDAEHQVDVLLDAESTDYTDYFTKILAWWLLLDLYHFPQN